MKIGFIGVGNVGGCLALKLKGAGHDALLANSRGPQSLANLAAKLGATAGTLADVVRQADVVILSVPMKAIQQLPENLFAGARDYLIVVDTGNYYSMRDGLIEALENGVVESRWVEQRLGRPVVKAFNNISADSLAHGSRPKGSPERFALPVSGDDRRAKDVVIGLIDEIGFDGLGAGGLDESWRQQPGSPAYCTNLDAERLRAVLQDLGTDDRAKLPERRDRALQEMMRLPNFPNGLESRNTVPLLRALAGL
jgi:predicted dinucleotide-binding enzyme